MPECFNVVCKALYKCCAFFLLFSTVGITLDSSFQSLFSSCARSRYLSSLVVPFTAVSIKSAILLSFAMTLLLLLLLLHGAHKMSFIEALYSQRLVYKVNISAVNIKD